MRLRDLIILNNIAAGGPGSGRTPYGVSRIPKSEFKLNARQKKVESAFRRMVGGNLEETMAKYKTANGNVLNADLAKELSPDYKAARSKYTLAVHEPASFLMKQMYAKELSQPAGQGKADVVFFTAGGAGAGKTSAIENNPVAKQALNIAQVVYDGTLRPAKSAIAKIDQALNAGKDVQIAYVHRDPVEAFKNGVLGRASRQEKAEGSGRTVPLDEFVSQHTSIQDSMKAVQDRYKDNPRFHMVTLDNSKGPGQAVKANLEDLPKSDSADVLRGKLKGVLNDEYQKGNISREIYKATIGNGASKEIGV